MIAGGALGAAAVTAVHLGLPADRAALVLALFLAATAASYPAALLARGTSPRGATIELATAGAIFICAVLGTTVAPAFLAAGYLGHGAWDWLHHARSMPARVVGWFPPGCAAFDLMAALGILIFI